MVMVALVAAGVASYMYISFKGIGMNINSLPVTAVGMGIGVDYILYVVDRIRREVPLAGGDMILGVKRAIATTGMAGTFSPTTIGSGNHSLYFMSGLRVFSGVGVFVGVPLMNH